MTQEIKHPSALYQDGETLFGKDKCALIGVLGDVNSRNLLTEVAKRYNENEPLHARIKELEELVGACKWYLEYRNLKKDNIYTRISRSLIKPKELNNDK